MENSLEDEKLYAMKDKIVALLTELEANEDDKIEISKSLNAYFHLEGVDPEHGANLDLEKVSTRFKNETISRIYKKMVINRAYVMKLFNHFDMVLRVIDELDDLDTDAKNT